MENFIRKVLHDSGFNGTETIKVGRSNSPAITSYQFIEAILNTPNTPAAAKYLGTSEQTVNRILAKVLIPCFGKLNGGNETWKYVLLKNAELKECHSCRAIKPSLDFSKDSTNSDSLDCKCRECKSTKNNSRYWTYKYTYFLPYIKAHRTEYNARHAKRRAAKLQRTPSWADLNKIKDFYLNCPKGMHVDHVIPLQGELVSGLHVEQNLQYLSAEANMKKGNRYRII